MESTYIIQIHKNMLPVKKNLSKQYKYFVYTLTQVSRFITIFKEKCLMHIFEVYFTIVVIKHKLKFRLSVK